MTEGTGPVSMETARLAQLFQALVDDYRLSILSGLHAGELESIEDVIRRSGSTEDIRRELEDQHLPVLDEADLIDWNRETGEVSVGPKFDEIRPLLEVGLHRKG